MSRFDKKVLGVIIGVMSALFIFAFLGTEDAKNELENSNICRYCGLSVSDSDGCVVGKSGAIWHADCYLEYLKEVNK